MSKITQTRQLNIPDNLNGKHLKAYLSIGNKLIKDERYSSAFLSGSILTGKYGPFSDLDIIALTKPKYNYSQTIYGYVSDTFYELFVYSQKKIDESFKRGDYHDMNMLGFGYCMFGNEKDFKKIRQKARNLFLKGPAKVNPEKLKYSKYLLWDKYCDILDIIETSPNLALNMMHNTIWEGLTIFYNQKRIWFPKRKRVLEFLMKVDPKLCKKFSLFLKTNNVKMSKKLKLFKAVIDHIIKPYSVSKPFIWKSKFG